MNDVADVRPSYAGALLRYRIMAYATGVVLITATLMLILQKVVDVKDIDTPTGLLWLAHGYLFLLYALATLHLGVKLRWHLIRIALTVVCGTIPGLSFVAERATVRYIHNRFAATTNTPSTTSGG